MYWYIYRNFTNSCTDQKKQVKKVTQPHWFNLIFYKQIKKRNHKKQNVPYHKLVRNRVEVLVTKAKYY